ncbi:hypothetical protein vBEcoMWL3_gp237 [Escherichia phage vB_EcoM_WL-3]|nr:hypothetical protein vBEcoMWL3_gp237 [Escherichia phage vB_EcoM_WL-3]
MNFCYARNLVFDFIFFRSRFFILAETMKFVFTNF